MPLRTGILVIGSLFWETDDVRQTRRRDRLRMQEAVDGRAPIRYGRISKGRGNTYTMVFSRACALGQAKVVPCRNEVRTANDLNCGGGASVGSGAEGTLEGPHKRGLGLRGFAAESAPRNCP
jgi:hypothetical protein